MSVYERFAEVYDMFMQDAPYAAWLSYVTAHWNLDSMDIADIGCGTGVLTVPLARLAKTCVGIDSSEAMLTIAQERAFDEHVRVDWLCQDIRKMRLPRQLDLAISTCDVLNYLSGLSHLEEACRAVHKSLKPGGIFAFDAIGPKRMMSLAQGYWHQIEEDAALLHETRVVDKRIEHEVHAFVLDEDGRYDRIEEHHVQMFYTAEEIISVLRNIGFTQIEAFPDFKHGRIDDADADRYIFVAMI